MAYARSDDFTLELVPAYYFRCFYCKKRVGVTMKQWKSIGSAPVKNLQCPHPSCNKINIDPTVYFFTFSK